MPITDETGVPWTRKHNHPKIPHLPSAPRIVYPRSLQELIEVCRGRTAGEGLKAAGSHWALSEAAVSDHTFIETHDPHEGHVAMGLTNVVPKFLNDAYVQRMVDMANEIKWSLVHVEAGKRIYQLYSELDQVGDVGDPDTLAGHINLHFGDPSFGGRGASKPSAGRAGKRWSVRSRPVPTEATSIDRLWPIPCSRSTWSPTADNTTGSSRQIQTCRR